MPLHAELVGPFPAGVDEESYDRLRRRILWTLPTGLYLLGSRVGNERNLMTCNLVSQVATSPKLVGVAVEREALTHRLVSEGGCFALNILDRSDRTVVRTFAKPAVDDADAKTLNGFAYRDAPVSGAPLFATALSYLDCRVVSALEFGSHTFFVGEVVDAAYLALASAESVPEVLRMEDTRMNYGG